MKYEDSFSCLFLHDFDSFIESLVVLLLEAQEPIIIYLTVYVVPISSAYCRVEHQIDWLRIAD